MLDFDGREPVRPAPLCREASAFWTSHNAATEARRAADFAERRGEVIVVQQTEYFQTGSTRRWASGMAGVLDRCAEHGGVAFHQCYASRCEAERAALEHGVGRETGSRQDHERVFMTVRIGAVADFIAWDGIGLFRPAEADLSQTGLTHVEEVAVSMTRERHKTGCRSPSRGRPQPLPEAACIDRGSA